MYSSSARRQNRLDSGEGLLEELAVIEKEGWEGPTAERLLAYVRAHVVRPQVVAAGLRGPAADQAEATGWAVAWETMSRSSMREARTPWGLLWVAVRRAIMGEVVGSAYLSGDRNGWRADSARHELQGRAGTAEPPVSLSVLIERGWEPPAQAGPGNDLGGRLEAVVSALVSVGWDERAALSVVEAVALTAVADGKSSTAAQGWRPLAARLGLPPWQVRRVTVLLLGAPGWPGLIERMSAGGCDVLDDAGIEAALRSTAISWWPPPPVAARKRDVVPKRSRALAAS